MSFGLKNTRVTYRRLLNKMFEELIGKTMEVYVHDMFVKSIKEEDHLKHISKVFIIIKRYGMKLNPNKCTFGVQGGKFLGYIINERYIDG